MINTPVSDTFYIFTDAATASQKNFSVGGYLYLNTQQINQYLHLSSEDLYPQITSAIIYQKYNSTKSTWAEIKTVIQAFKDLLAHGKRLTLIEIYTDCQSVCDLIGPRKARLLKNNFTNRSGKVLANAALYKEFYSVSANLQIKFHKIKGHAPTIHRQSLPEKIFTILDKSVRKALREYQKS